MQTAMGEVDALIKAINIISSPLAAPSPPPPRRHAVRLDPDEHFVAQQDIHPSKWTRVKTAAAKAWRRYSAESDFETIDESESEESESESKKERVLAEVDHILSMPVEDICDYLAETTWPRLPSEKPRMHLHDVVLELC